MKSHEIRSGIAFVFAFHNKVSMADNFEETQKARKSKIYFGMHVETKETSPNLTNLDYVTNPETSKVIIKGVCWVCITKKKNSSKKKYNLI